MSRLSKQSGHRAVATLVVLLVCGSAARGRGQELQEPAGAPGATVYLYAPRAGEAALGKVRVRADVLADVAPVEVRFLVDGVERARFESPPFEAVLDVGEENREHVFEVVVRHDGRELQRVTRRTPSIRIDEVIDLGLRQLYVTAVRGGQAVHGLQRDEFEVLDDGRVQEIVTFEGGDAPLTAAILIDASESMAGGALDTAVAGALSFVRQLRELDLASLVVFSDRTLAETAFAGASGIDESGLGQLAAGGGTTINDHLYLALRRLARRQGRRVVILLSDGVDVHSVLDGRDLVWAGRRSDAMVYWIQLDAEGSEHGMISPWRDADTHLAQLDDLRRVVEASGGRVVPIADSRAAEAAFREILHELRSQYVLGYYPTPRRPLDPWRRVAVRTAAPGVEIRTREGYLDPAATITP